jgi:hypothetical protein
VVWRVWSEEACTLPQQTPTPDQRPIRLVHKNKRSSDHIQQPPVGMANWSDGSDCCRLLVQCASTIRVRGCGLNVRGVSVRQGIPTLIMQRKRICCINKQTFQMLTQIANFHILADHRYWMIPMTIKTIMH